MRKIVFIIIALFAISQNICAQGMTATLQSGDNLKVFYGIDAFKEAYEAAKDGDQITLSAGTFNALANSVSKSVKITGVGAFEDTGNTIIDTLYISGSDVRIEGIRLSNKLDATGSVNLIVTRCRVYYLYASNNYTNPLFNECALLFPRFLKYARGFTIKNSTINTFNGNDNQDVTNVGNILNCVIYYYPNTLTPHAIYKNCLIGRNASAYDYTTIRCESPSEFYYNAFYMDANSTWSSYDLKINYSTGCNNSGNVNLNKRSISVSFPANENNVGNGDDGTPIGIYGGTGFSKYPAIPRIVNKTIDSSINDEGKINVNIEVKAE